MITTKSLRIDYDELTAVADLDLDIKPGEIFGLVGPNGAGKTSTIKAIAGIIEPTYGEIKIAGFDLELNTQQALAHLGYMPDFSPVYENLTVWEYLDVFAAAYLVPASERRKQVDTWMERVSLGGKRNEFIRNLSRGMRQRLVLAKTLLPRPSALLLDEPASGMDPIARMELRGILKDVAAGGASVIISSHILTELSEFCTAIGIMEKGKMVVSGSMTDIRTRTGSTGRLVIRLANPDPAQVQRVMDNLKAQTFLSEPTITTPDTCEAAFRGSNNQAADLIKTLVEQHIPIMDYHLLQDNMEDIFFKVGAREVS